MRMQLTLLALLLLVGAGLAAPTKVINLKNLLAPEEWILEITYHARDQFEDRDHTAELEMTATAMYVLKRVSSSSVWGNWQANDCQSHNLTYRAFWHSKHTPSDMTDYSARAGGKMEAPLADFQIGGYTPGFQLIAGGGFPSHIKSVTSGDRDSSLVLGTTRVNMPGLSGVLSGPLPESGTTISGSVVIPAEVPPFVTGVAGPTRMSIQYVLRPTPVAPLGR